MRIPIRILIPVIGLLLACSDDDNGGIVDNGGNGNGGSAWQLLGGWQLPADAPDLTERIARAAAMAAERRRRPWHARPVVRLLAAAAAAVLVAAAIGYALGRASRPERPARMSHGAGRADEDDLMRVLHLRTLGSSPVGLADLPLSHTIDARETPQ